MADLQITTCDDVNDWGGNTNCTTALDNVDYQEGTGSVKNTTTASGWCAVSYDPAGDWDWSGYDYLIMWVKGTSGRDGRVRLQDSDGDSEYFNFQYNGAWQELTFTYGAGDGVVGTPDYSKMTLVRHYIYAADAGNVFSADDVRVGPVAGGVSVPVLMNHLCMHVAHKVRGG